jgi:hypothetical protein
MGVNQLWSLFVFLASEILLVFFMPALGLTLSLDGHFWLFDSRLEITASVLPPPGHINARARGVKLGRKIVPR